MTKFFAIVFLGTILFQLTSPAQDTMMTVRGPISSGDMGLTLPHEHLLVDFIGADSTGYFRWNKEQVVDKVLPFLLEIKARGVITFVDCTPAFLGRDPVLLKMLAEKSGLHILTTTGFYGAFDNKYVPRWAFEQSAGQLAELWIREFQEGIEDTGIRPGIIKISVERNKPLSDIHKKLVHAAALTHLATGLTIVSHTGPELAAFEQVAMLQELGVSPTAFVWTHANEGSQQAHIDLAQKGAWISLDKMNDRPETVAGMVAMLKNLKEKNLLQQVLISHDAGWYDPAKPNGGNFRGYTAIFTHMLPALRENGFSDADIELLMIKNPQRAFAVQIRTLKKE